MAIAVPPLGLCWRYTPPRRIDVFEVFECLDALEIKRTKVAAESLMDRGFDVVVIHDHQAKEFLSCACPVHEPEARTE